LPFTSSCCRKLVVVVVVNTSSYVQVLPQYSRKIRQLSCPPTWVDVRSRTVLVVNAGHTVVHSYSGKELRCFTPARRGQREARRRTSDMQVPEWRIISPEHASDKHYVDLLCDGVYDISTENEGKLWSPEHFGSVDGHLIEVYSSIELCFNQSLIEYIKEKMEKAD
jgi:hypothetical protein